MYFIGISTMAKLKIATICFAFIGTAAVLALAAPQDAGAERATDQAEKVPDAKKRDAPPPFAQRADYVVEPTDLIQVQVENTLPGRPIAPMDRLVRPDGRIQLGFYGELDVAGLTIPEIKIGLVRHMQRFLEDETLGLVILGDNGQPVVDPATGKPRRIDPKDSKAVRVELVQCNSKYFYVLGEVVSPGRFPVTGTQSILDAIDLAGGLNPSEDRAKFVLYRLGTHGSPHRRTVNLDQIKQGSLPSTEIRLRAGDRLVIHRQAGDRIEADNNIGTKPSQARSRPRREIDATARAKAVERSERDEVATEGASMQRLEKRMADLEHKLDLILERVKKAAG
jgi:polysaccharide biosynthesis/export protein